MIDFATTSIARLLCLITVLNKCVLKLARAANINFLLLSQVTQSTGKFAATMALPERVMEKRRREGAMEGRLRTRGAKEASLTTEERKERVNEDRRRRKME